MKGVQRWKKWPAVCESLSVWLYIAWSVCLLRNGRGVACFVITLPIRERNLQLKPVPDATFQRRQGLQAL
jgi:hypothetical protein